MKWRILKFIGLFPFIVNGGAFAWAVKEKAKDNEFRREVTQRGREIVKHLPEKRPKET